MIQFNGASLPPRRPCATRPIASDYPNAGTKKARKRVLPGQGRDWKRGDYAMRRAASASGHARRQTEFSVIWSVEEIGAPGRLRLGFAGQARCSVDGHRRWPGSQPRQTRRGLICLVHHAAQSKKKCPAGAGQSHQSPQGRPVGRHGWPSSTGSVTTARKSPAEAGPSRTHVCLRGVGAFSTCLPTRRRRCQTTPPP
jgi:hypothetical protein